MSKKKKQKELCPTCGATMSEHVHHLNRGLVRFLEELHASGGEARIRSLKLNHTERNNANKARYFGLVESVIVDEETKRKRGHWRLTPLGLLFLNGRVSLHRKVITYRNEVVASEGERVYIDQVDPDFRVRQDYIEDMRPHRQ